VADRANTDDGELGSVSFRLLRMPSTGGAGWTRWGRRITIIPADSFWFALSINDFTRHQQGLRGTGDQSSGASLRISSSISRGLYGFAM
jgi:hypothetical protein